jgi:hypothetical protein
VNGKSFKHRQDPLSKPEIGKQDPGAAENEKNNVPGIGVQRRVSRKKNEPRASDTTYLLLIDICLGFSAGRR